MLCLQAMCAEQVVSCCSLHSFPKIITWFQFFSSVFIYVSCNSCCRMVVCSAWRLCGTVVKLNLPFNDLSPRDVCGASLILLLFTLFQERVSLEGSFNFTMLCSRNRQYSTSGSNFFSPTVMISVVYSLPLMDEVL